MELVINTFGSSLSRDNEGFVISNIDGKQRILATNVSSIQICKGVQITSDAILLAIENEIDIVFNNKVGTPIARVWSPKYGSISTIRRGQLSFTYTADALEWIKQVVMRKIENQQAQLLMMPADNLFLQNSVKKAVNRLEDYRTKISGLKGEIVNDVSPTLRGWEGVASKIYFETINLFLPDEYKFEKRSQNPAMDAANALLNYGYGVLYGKIESSLIKAGIDPYIGVMHRDDYNRPVLVYDVIELYRIWVDYVVISLLMQKAITDEHYSVREDGSCWLESLGRRVLIQSVNDFLEEVVNNDGLQRSRMTQINLYCQDLAQKFKKYN